MQSTPAPATTNSSTVASVLQRIPPFPTALAVILRSCAAEEPSVAEIARAVAMEEVLAARVVRAANAVALAPVHAVDNVTAAVARLGASAVRGIASAYYLSNTFMQAFANSGLDRQALWRHNLAVAAASAGAAGPGGERANAYFAGLMHDVGKMIFAAELGHVYGDCIAEAIRTGQDIVRVEEEMLGIDHAGIGAEAAEHWNFAPEVVTAIRRHHQVLGAGLLPPLASHVLVGNRVANEMGFTVAEPGSEATAAATGSIASGIGAGIMSRARWALTTEIPRIESLITEGVV